MLKREINKKKSHRQTRCLNGGNKSIPYRTTRFTKTRQKIKQKSKHVSNDCSLPRQKEEIWFNRHPNNSELKHAFAYCRKTYNKLRSL